MRVVAMVGKPIDWSKMVRVWSCYENRGFSPRTTQGILPVIKSPVLLVGGGAGLNPRFFIENGYQIESIDNCPEMIRHAKQVRNIDILHCDARHTPFADGSFKSVILSTGVLNAANLYQESYLNQILSEVERLTEPGGKVVVAYLQEVGEIEYICKHLQLQTVPSKHVYFIQSERLEEVKRLFLEDPEVNNDVVHYIFSEFKGLLSSLHQKFQCIRQELVMQKSDPYSFVADNFGFRFFDLSPLDEVYLVSKIKTFFRLVDHRVLCDDQQFASPNVKVIIAEHV
jgi:SAM-dependent methyltransferase